MRIGVRVIRGKKIDRIEATYRKAVEQIILSGCQDTINTAKQSIQAHGSSGITYTKYNPRRTHTASAAGNPPNTDTGFLVNNIFVEIDADRLGGSVESRADYSGFLEFGTSKMQARPYLQPALEENKPKIRARVRKIKARF